MTLVEIRPPIPFPMARLEHARGASIRAESDVDDWVWTMRLEEEGVTLADLRRPEKPQKPCIIWVAAANLGDDDWLKVRT